MRYNLSALSLTDLLSQCSNLLTGKVFRMPSQIQISETATVLGQLPYCLLGECSIWYMYLPQLSAVHCQCQHTLLCHLTVAVQCDLLQVRVAACHL